MIFVLMKSFLEVLLFVLRLIFLYYFYLMMAFVAHILVLNELEQHQAMYALKVQRRRLRDIYNPFDLREYDFTKLFRISKNLALYIIDKLSNVQRLQRKRKNGLSLQLQVSIKYRKCINYYNVGTYYVHV